MQDIDLVIEGTGVFVSSEGAGKHLQAGAKKVCQTTVMQSTLRAFGLLLSRAHSYGQEYCAVVTSFLATSLEIIAGCMLQSCRTYSSNMY